MNLLEQMSWIEANGCVRNVHCDGLDAIMSPERPITVDEACSLRNLLFGDLQRSFGKEWSEQSFRFKRKKPFPYGIIQKRGGPCGVLAAIQAFVIKELLFGIHKSPLDSGVLRPTLSEKRVALSTALANILWTARGRRGVLVALKKDTIVLDDKIVSRDGILEYVHLKHFSCKSCLLHYYLSCANELMDDSSGSCVLFLYSLILSHGIEETKKESENPECLIGIDGFSSQEIINLMLVGKAVPHLFDGNQECDFGGSETSLLHGIPHKSEIGLLSSLDQHCAVGFSKLLADFSKLRISRCNFDKIGSFYKNPKNPIFLLICGHHYTVLFGTSRRILMDTQDEFTLYHYDGFDRTETAYIIKPYKKNSKKTKNSKKSTDVKEETEDDNKTKNSVIKCIYTRWPRAIISEKKKED